MPNQPVFHASANAAAIQKQIDSLRNQILGLGFSGDSLVDTKLLLQFEAMLLLVEALLVMGDGIENMKEAVQGWIHADLHAKGIIRD